MNPQLPPVAPEVAAAAVEALTSRLRKKLDAAIDTYVAAPVIVEGAVRRVRCGEDAEVVLAPGPSGAVTDAGEAVCSCLLAPKCLHRAAVLGACPVADLETAAAVDATAQEVGASEQDTAANTVQDIDAVPESDTAALPPQTGPTDAQLTAAHSLWAAAAAVLAAGVPAAGAVAQAEVLR
ncbi:SWIM zinc finger family protein, partial [Streptomyces sp. W16]|nr:SWIM zinc finger family protein [Streptomyces sp. W16]